MHAHHPGAAVARDRELVRRLGRHRVDVTGDRIRLLARLVEADGALEHQPGLGVRMPVQRWTLARAVVRGEERDPGAVRLALERGRGSGPRHEVGELQDLEHAAILAGAVPSGEGPETGARKLEPCVFWRP